MLRLRNKLSECDVFYNSPFNVFEINNILDKEFYNKLRDTFPDELLVHKIQKRGLKKSLDNHMPDFQKFLSENKEWNDFYNYLNSKKTISLLFNFINDYFFKIKERRNLKKFHFIKNSYYQKLHSKLENLIFKPFYSNITLGMEFSILKNGCEIPPHPDFKQTLLPFMIYFPEKKEDIELEQINNLGTEFYEKKDSLVEDNFDGWKDGFVNENKLDLFRKCFKVFHRSKFEENKLVGFIKDENSWHGVQSLKTNMPYSRKSVNININLIR